MLRKGADGKWTQDANVASFVCPHEWQPHFCGFYNAVYHEKPAYELECKLCKQQITTHVRLFPKKAKCQHEWIESKELGPRYEACWICLKGKIKNPSS